MSGLRCDSKNREESNVKERTHGLEGRREKGEKFGDSTGLESRGDLGTASLAR